MRNLLITVLLVMSTPLAQSQIRGGLLPEVSVSHRWAGNKWRITGQVESMQRLFTKAPGESLEATYNYVRTDLTSVVTYRLAPDWSIGGGTMLRFTNGESITRMIQQISLTRRGSSIRWAHRLRTDQTFNSGSNLRFRIRYRFSFELPLNGQSLNDREWYTIMSIEQIADLQTGNSDWEQRAAIAIGYFINAKHKVELGLDYRVDNFIDGSARHGLWTMLNYFVNL